MVVLIKGSSSSRNAVIDADRLTPALVPVAFETTRDAKGTGVTRQRWRHGVFQRRRPSTQQVRAAPLRQSGVKTGSIKCAFERLSDNTMSLQKVTPGAKAPDEFNVIIEIPMNADPIKYEVDKASGALFVDRFMTTAMHYPCNYGYIPQTLSDDGDPVDVLVITPFALSPGVVVTCRAVGVLKMEDEAGGDSKVLAVPIDKILPIYTHWQKPEDINQMRLKAIQHFFEHYKDLEAGKWVKVKGWEGPEEAKEEIRQGIAAYRPA
jgi:inorganic pyrophosphatase